MEVIKAQSAGFCFGVRTAVKMLEETVAQNSGPVYTWGPIIHNDHVVASFAEQGVRVIHTEEELEQVHEGTVIIRSHGTTRAIVQKMNALGLTVIDGTCPFVKKIHHIVEEQGNLGRHVIVIGKPSHPEVQGIAGWCTGPYSIVETESDAQNLVLPENTSVCIVSQTTFYVKEFHNLVEILTGRVYDSIVLDTICHATSKRQEEVDNLADSVDMMLVVGDRKSSNTQKLFRICKAKCEKTYYVETVADIQLNWFHNVKRIGVTAGASTPDNIIEEVLLKCQI